MTVSLKEFSEVPAWAKHWAGGWSLLSCTYFGHQYTQTIRRTLGISVRHAVFVSHKGFSSAFLPESELSDFGTALATKVREDEELALEWCKLLKKRTGEILAAMGGIEAEKASGKEFSKFLDAFYAYVEPHIAVKKVVDYLPQKTLDELLPALTEARLYSEKVYAESEEFVKRVAKGIGERENYSPELVLCLTKEELADYFNNGKLPPKAKLEGRLAASALAFADGDYLLLAGAEFSKAEAWVAPKSAAKELRGTPAYAGTARGTVRIVLNPASAAHFKQGDILVTGMTRPEYVALIKKSAAFVTDAGGVLSHAAIVARELKKPCIVGTQTATKQLKDGMTVEVDATRGVVRIIV